MSSSPTNRDRGLVLPLVLVITVVLSLVVVAIASYAAGTLRLGQVVEESTDRVAAAEGGIDWALDRYDRGETGCFDGVGQEIGTFEGEVNGLRAEVTCQLVGDAVLGAAAYAVVMTGEELTSKSLLRVTNGACSSQAEKVFTGPIYMERLDFDMSACLDIEEGHLLHHDASCPGDFVPSSPTLPSFLRFVTPGRGANCTDIGWQARFDTNAPIPQLTTPAVSSQLTDPMPITDPNGCTIWLPGTYTASGPLDFGIGSGYHYMVSGNYVFQNLGPIPLKNSFVLAGYPGIRGPSIIQKNDDFDTHPCRDAWWYDGLESGSIADGERGDRLGATIYLDGNSQFSVDAQASLEISGRVQSITGSASRVRVSLQALSGTTIRGDNSIVNTQSGSGSQMSMAGMVWAPYSSFSLELVSNVAVAALRGGAVVASLDAGAAAQASGFLVEVGIQSIDTQLMVESTAGDSVGVTVRAILDYQLAPADVSILSRRVLDITPE